MLCDNKTEFEYISLLKEIIIKSLFVNLVSVLHQV